EVIEHDLLGIGAAADEDLVARKEVVKRVADGAIGRGRTLHVVVVDVAERCARGRRRERRDERRGAYRSPQGLSLHEHGVCPPSLIETLLMARRAPAWRPAPCAPDRGADSPPPRR